MEVLPTRIFTREDPCTKVHIHNCFATEDGEYVPVPVVQARGWIGLNTPKYLLRENYAQAVHVKGVDYYRLTDAGKAWLHAGLLRHLELHPEDRGAVIKPIIGYAKPTAKRITRKRA